MILHQIDRADATPGIGLFLIAGICCLLPSSRRSKQFFLVGWGVDLQQIPLIAALVEADTPLGISDQFELRRLQLKVVHIKPLIHTAGVEQELMGGDGEEGASQLPDARLVEIAIGNPPLLPIP